MRTPHTTARTMYRELSEALGATRSGGWTHAKRFRDMLVKALPTGSAVIFGCHRDCTWGVCWTGVGAIEHFVPCTLTDWLDTPSRVISQVRAKNASTEGGAR